VPRLLELVKKKLPYPLSGRLMNKKVPPARRDFFPERWKVVQSRAKGAVQREASLALAASCPSVTFLRLVRKKGAEYREQAVRFYYSDL